MTLWNRDDDDFSYTALDRALLVILGLPVVLGAGLFVALVLWWGWGRR